MRAELLEKGETKEGVVTIDDLREAAQVREHYSLLAWTGADLLDCAAARDARDHLLQRRPRRLSRLHRSRRLAMTSSSRFSRLASLALSGIGCHKGQNDRETQCEIVTGEGRA